MRNKGQAFLSDFAVSMALFGVVLTAFFIPWNTMVQSQERFSNEKIMEEQAQRTAALMISSSGYPQNWDNTTSDVMVPGFSDGKNNVISSTKLEAFKNMTRLKRQNALNVRNYRLTFLDSNSNILSYSGDASGNIYEQGNRPSSDAETVVKVDRKVLVNKSGGLENAEMNYVVWR